MAIMWNGSITPWIDPNGDPYSGAQAFFFDAGTTTPRTVYIDSDLSEPHDHPVIANSAGRFPAVFLPAGDYRLRIEDADDVTLEDVDGISTPISTPPETPEGDTPVELLARTGDYKFRHGTGSHSGWVRAAGRTIGNASSGASERANADCEDLFLFLWDQDSTLSVSGGRGANAASDWAASKNIALPDIRLRPLIGMASMGNSASTLISAASFDGGEDGDDLGATVGVSTVTLSTSQIPSHSHTASASTDGDHAHGYSVVVPSGGGNTFGNGNTNSAEQARTTSTTGAHTHTITVNAAGGGGSHTNVQPSAVATCYIKL